MEAKGVEFNKRLTWYRKNANLSQEELAKMLCVTRQAISKWERGEGMPDVDNIVALSRVYRITIDELLTGDKNIEQFDPQQTKKVQTKKNISKMAFTLIWTTVVYLLLATIEYLALRPFWASAWVFYLLMPCCVSVHFAIVFRSLITSKYIMYFIPIPIMCGIAYVVLNSFSVLEFMKNTSWVLFLVIPLYYIIAAAVTLIKLKEEGRLGIKKDNICEQKIID